MTSRIQNAVSGLLVVAMMALTASATNIFPDEKNIQRTITKVVDKQKSQLQKYREGLLSLVPSVGQSFPTQEELLPILHELVSYKSQLTGTDWNENTHRLATEINAPLKIYWNKYRGNSFVEIVDTYISDNHGDAELASLEFLVKKNLISFEDWVQNKGLADMLPNDFILAQRDMELALYNMPTRDGSSIVKSFVDLAAAYNRLYQNAETRPLALQLYKTYFRQPIAAGWQRTVTVKELRSRYGMKNYMEPFSTDELKTRYGVSQKEAETLHAFFLNYHN